MVQVGPLRGGAPAGTWLEVGQRDTADRLLHILANGRGTATEIELRLDAMGSIRPVASVARGPE